MTTLISVQSTTSTPGEAGKFLLSPGGEGSGSAFSAVLTELIHEDRGPDTAQSVVTPHGGATMASLVIPNKLAEKAAVRTNGATIANPSGSKAPSGATDPPITVAKMARRAMVDQTPLATSQRMPPNVANEAPKVLNSVTSFAVADGVPPAATGEVPVTIADVPLATISGQAPQKVASSDPEARGHVKSGKRIAKEVDWKPVSASDQNPPGVILGASDLLLQVPVANVSPVQNGMKPPTSPGTSVATSSRIGEGGTQKDVDTHRVDLPSHGEGQPLRPDDPTQPATLAPPSGDDAKSEKLAVRSDMTSELQAASARSEPSLGSVSGTESSPVARPAQDQPALAIGQATPTTDQIAPALVGVLKTTDGTHSVIVRLQPAELGQVQIRIDRNSEGVAHVDVTVDRPETLELLQRDQPRLDQALDQAGIPSAGRNVSFSLAPTEQIGATAVRPDGMTAGSGDSGQGQSGGAWRESSDSRREPGNDPGSDQQQARARWFRAGLDITA
jgi:flagellar hook-length control protein FliK